MERKLTHFAEVVPASGQSQPHSGANTAGLANPFAGAEGFVEAEPPGAVFLFQDKNGGFIGLLILHNDGSGVLIDGANRPFTIFQDHVGANNI